MFKFTQKTLSTSLFLSLCLTLLISAIAPISISTKAEEKARNFERVSDDWRKQVVVNLKPGASSGQVWNKLRSNNDTIKGISTQSLGEQQVIEDKLVFKIENATDFTAIESKLKSFNEVASVGLNYPYQSLYTPNDPLFGSNWQLQDAGNGIKMQSAWNSVGSALGVGTCTESAPLCGGKKEVKVAVIDSGVQTNIAEFNNTTFSNPAEFYYSFSPCTPNSTVLFLSGEYLCRANTQNDTCPIGKEDRCGHGTAVTSVIAGSDNSLGTVGVAYNTTIIPISVRNAFDSLGLSQAIKHARQSGADVINMSLGSPFNDPTVYQEVVNARNAGIIVVAASGNCGSLPGGHPACFPTLQPGDAGYGIVNPILYPAYFNEVVSVGAINQDGTRSSYSTFNDQVDVVAPVGAGFPIAKIDGTFATASGTSFSAPQVAGVAALFKSIRGNVGSTSADFISILALNSKDLGTAGRDNQFGNGLINANFTAVAPNPSISNLQTKYNFNTSAALNITDLSGLTLTEAVYTINNQNIETRNNPANLNKTIVANNLVSGKNPLSIVVEASNGSKGKVINEINVEIPWSQWFGIGEMFDTASSVVIDGRIVQTVQGSGNWIYTRYSDNEGQTWSTWLRDGQMFSEASSVVIDGRIVQTVQGSGNWIYTRHSDNKGQTWSTWLRDGQMFAPASSVVIDGRILQTVRGSGDWIFTRHSDNKGQTWSTWLRDGQMFAPASSVVLGNRILQAVRGSSNDLYTRHSDNKGQTWSVWQKHGKIGSAPELVSVDNTYAILTYTDINTDIAYLTYKNLVGWSKSPVIVGKMLNASSTIYSGGVLIQTVRGTDNKIYTRRFSAS
jgi:hypothetical protein